VLTFDLHSGQIQGFFNIPIDELSSLSLLVRHFQNRVDANTVIVAPDFGFLKRARNFAAMLGVPLAVVEKRHNPETFTVIGDITGKRCIIIDDEIATGKTVVRVANLLAERGVEEIIACCIHPVLVPQALERIQQSPIGELVTTDTLPVVADTHWPGLTVVTVSNVLAEVIQRIHSGISVDTIFQYRNHPALA
jgi:ribose-phosphate pyrophosphokinase